MSEELKPRCAKCQGWRQTRNEEAVTLVNGTALCAWHAKEGERDELARLRAENERYKKLWSIAKADWKDGSESHKWHGYLERAETAEAKVAAMEKVIEAIGRGTLIGGSIVFPSLKDCAEFTAALSRLPAPEKKPASQEGHGK